MAYVVPVSLIVAVVFAVVLTTIAGDADTAGLTRSPGVPASSSSALATAAGQASPSVGAAPTSSAAPAPTSSPVNDEPATTAVSTASTRAAAKARPAPRAKAPVPRVPAASPAKPHIMVIVMENETYSDVIGNPSLPYLNGTLAAHYLVLQDAYAVAHPSLPNYLELASGSTSGVTSDCAPGPHCQGGENLAAQLDQAGIGWSGYMESMPSPGYTGGDTGGDDGYGNQLYAQHHDPFVYFPDLAADLPAHVKPLSAMVGDLNGAQPPAFVWVSPNMVDDMHDGPLSTGDTWLSEAIPQIQATSWYRSGGTIVLTWDEGPDADTSGIAGGSGGHVVGLVISQALYGSRPDTTPVDDAGILRSIEAAYGVGYLNDAANPVHGSVPGL